MLNEKGFSNSYLVSFTYLVYKYVPIYIKSWKSCFANLILNVGTYQELVRWYNNVFYFYKIK